MRDNNFTLKALFHSPNFSEGIVLNGLFNGVIKAMVQGAKPTQTKRAQDRWEGDCFASLAMTSIYYFVSDKHTINSTL